MIYCFKLMIYHVQVYDLPCSSLRSTYFPHSAETSVLAKNLVDHKLELCFGQKNKNSHGQEWGVGSVVVEFRVFGAPRFSVQRSPNCILEGCGACKTENRGAPKNTKNQPRRIQHPLIASLKNMKKHAQKTKFKLMIYLPPGNCRKKHFGKNKVAV